MRHNPRPPTHEHHRICKYSYTYSRLVQVAKMWLDQGDIVLIADSDGIRYASRPVACPAADRDDDTWGLVHHVKHHIQPNSSDSRVNVFQHAAVSASAPCPPQGLV
jgi:hypothetical protein